MKTKQILRMLIGISLTVASCGQERVSPAADLGNPNQHEQGKRKYQDALQKFAMQWNQPGVSMLLAWHAEVVWMGAVGKANLTKQTDLVTTDSFRAGSITKTFVASAVMKLQEQGKLQLDDVLGTLLTEVTGRISGADRITIRQMLSHTSGIFDPANDDPQYQLDLLNDPNRRLTMSTRDLLARYVYGRKLRFEPGTQYGYSNTNYWLLGMVIEKTTGKALQTVLDEFIFRPAGLTNTYFEVRDDREVVRGYNDFYSNRKLMDVSSLDRADSEGLASGGIITTIEDLYRFSSAFFGGKIVSPASLKAMMTIPSLQHGRTDYGLGLDSYQSPLGRGWGHNGTLLGVDVNWFYFPDHQATYILFGNNGGGADKSFVDELLID